MFAKVMGWLKGEPAPTYDHRSPLEVPYVDPYILYPKLSVFPLTPPETEEVNVNLDAMTPAELTAFINEKEKDHREAVKAMRALLRAKIALAPKSKIEEEVTVG